MKTKTKDSGKQASSTIVQTSIGPLEIIWTADSLIKISTPKGKRKSLLVESTPPKWVLKLAKGIESITEGRSFDFSEMPIDLTGVTPFFRKIYTLVRKIPFGEVQSYGDLARRAGSPQAARAVGQAMARNPWPFVIPCHRVLASNGKIGGFSLANGPDTKIQLLQAEGVKLN